MRRLFLAALLVACAPGFAPHVLLVTPDAGDAAQSADSDGSVDGGPDAGDDAGQLDGAVMDGGGDAGSIDSGTDAGEMDGGMMCVDAGSPCDDLDCQIASENPLDYCNTCTNRCAVGCNTHDDCIFGDTCELSTHSCIPECPDGGSIDAGHDGGCF